MRFMNYNFCSQSATTITASSEDPSFLASNLKHEFRSKRWRSTDVTAENVVFDLITTEAIDSVVILWPKEDGIRLSDTAIVKIQANATDVWTSPSVDQTLTINNDYLVASHFFSTDQSYRYWRVVIEDPGNAYGYVELGMVWLGKSIDIPNAQNGFGYSLVDRSKVSTTDFGHTYVDEYPQFASLNFSYQFLDYAEIQLLENAFRANGNRKPVLVVLDAEEAMFDKDHFVIYGKMDNSFKLQHVQAGILNIPDMSVLELA